MYKQAATNVEPKVQLVMAATVCLKTPKFELSIVELSIFPLAGEPSSDRR